MLKIFGENLRFLVPRLLTYKTKEVAARWNPRGSGASRTWLFHAGSVTRATNRFRESHECMERRCTNQHLFPREPRARNCGLELQRRPVLAAQTLAHGSSLLLGRAPHFVKAAR